MTPLIHIEASIPACPLLVKLMLILTLILLLVNCEICNRTLFGKILISGTLGMDFDHEALGKPHGQNFPLGSHWWELYQRGWDCMYPYLFSTEHRK